MSRPDEVVILASVAMTTARSVLVIPHGDQERAAWLHFSEGVTVEDDVIDGRRRIRLDRGLAERRGLGSVIQDVV